MKHLGELRFDELAEERSDVDAGKEIARASRTPGRADVVADLRIVERQLHERGHGQRAALSDGLHDVRATFFDLRPSQPHFPTSLLPCSLYSQSFFTDTNVSLVPRQTIICARWPDWTF